MRVQVIRAWPGRHEAVGIELPLGAVLADALAACGIDRTGVAGYAVFGVRAAVDTPLADGDRVELLGPLLMDPKEARRRRAEDQRTRRAR